MSITWTEDSDSRAMLAPSVEMQQNVASFGASDYAIGGYAIYPSAFGLPAIRSLIPTGFSATSDGTPGASVWVPVKPAASPAASNPWYLKAGYYDADGFVEASADTDFSGGTLNVTAIGY